MPNLGFSKKTYQEWKSVGRRSVVNRRSIFNITLISYTPFCYVRKRSLAAQSKIRYKLEMWSKA